MAQSGFAIAMYMSGREIAAMMQFTIACSQNHLAGHTDRREEQEK
jgi:hypothetical protein